MKDSNSISDFIVEAAAKNKNIAAIFVIDSSPKTKKRHGKNKDLLKKLVENLSSNSNRTLNV